MDTANLIASWMSCVATVVGLGAVYNVIRPFSPPLGPVIKASLEDDFCGYPIVYLTPTPIPITTRVPCPTFFGVIHPTTSFSPFNSTIGEEKTLINYSADQEERDIGVKSNSPSIKVTRWRFTPERPVVYHESVFQDFLSTSNNKLGKGSGFVISRSTLLAMLVIQSVRILQYSKGPSGIRYVFRGYTGIFTVDWPLGKSATVRFNNLDTRTSREDVYPRGFFRNVKSAINMLCGVVDNKTSGFCLGVSGRKAAGRYLLHYSKAGFNGRVAARDLYDHMGGDVYKPGFLSFTSMDKSGRRMSESESKSQLSFEIADTDCMQLEVPALSDGCSTLFIAPQVQLVVAEMMDKLPWTQLGWSMHRGLRDLVLAYGNELWSARRKAFAGTLRRAISGRESILIAQGWSHDFVHYKLATLVEDGVQHDSLSVVRAVTSVALLLRGRPNTNDDELNETVFWRNNLGSDIVETDFEMDLDVDTVIALSKLYTIQCSYEFDYGIYVDMPVELLLV